MGHEAGICEGGGRDAVEKEEGEGGEISPHVCESMEPLPKNERNRISYDQTFASLMLCLFVWTIAWKVMMVCRGYIYIPCYDIAS